MAQPPLGLQEAVGLGIEATYGTGVAPGVWWKPVSCTLRRAWVPLSMAGISGSSADVVYGTPSRAFRSAPVIAGQIVLEAEYHDLAWLLYAVYGPAASAGGPNYTHTFTHATSPVVLPPGLSIARLNGLEDMRYTGCKVVGFTLAFTAGSIVTVTLDIIGRDGGDAEVADAATEGYSASAWLEFQHSQLMYATAVSTALTVGAHGQDEDDAPSEFSFSTQHTYRIMEEPGTGLIREPVKDGYSVSTLTFKRDWATQTFKDKMANTAINTAFASFGINVTTGATEILDIQIPHALLMGDQNTEFAGGGGIIPENITVKAADDLNEPPVSIVLTNTTETFVQADSVGA